MENILMEYGCPAAPSDKDNIARITAVHKERYGIVSAAGENFAKLKSSVYYNGGAELFPTVGDYVEITPNPFGDSLITRTLPRQSFFSRPDVFVAAWEQAVAANFDYVFIVMSLNQNFNLRRLERYLTSAWQSGGIPVVVLTKLDLCEEPAPLIREAERTAAGAAVCAVSALTGEGLEQLSEYLKPQKTIVFLGSSGVGKSSLTNALAGEDLMKVSAIREEDARGRHTTTHRQLLKLPSGVLIIDTPGMRELGMWDVSEGLGEAFADVEDFLGQCRFADCSHQNEPGCAVRAAIASGVLSENRWASYQQLKREALYSEDKGEFLRQRQAKHKAIARMVRQRKRDRRVKY